MNSGGFLRLTSDRELPVPVGTNVSGVSRESALATINRQFIERANR